MIDLCSKNQTTTSELNDGEESTKQESWDTVDSKTIARLESKNRHEKDYQVAETEEIKVVMMYWENSEDSPGKEPYKETDAKEENPDEEMPKPKDEEEHVDSTLHTGNQLKISVKAFSWGMEDNALMLGTQETDQRE